MLPRRVAKQALSVIGSTLSHLVSMLVSSNTSLVDVALCRLIRWIYAALNSYHWSADEVIHGNVDWLSVRDSVQQLSVAGSMFSKKMHAAKIYALLRSVVLLESHLEVFAADRGESESSSEEESSEGEY